MPGPGESLISSFSPYYGGPSCVVETGRNVRSSAYLLKNKSEKNILSV
jgi:hypothetical protein